MDPLSMMGIASAVNAGVSYLGMERTNAANKELAKYQFQKNLEMWNRQNEYNNPIQQMDRLQKAGLNPHLVYGNGAIGNTTGNLPQYNAPKLDYNYTPNIDVPSMLGTFQNMKVQQAQTENLESQTDKTKAETLNTLVQNGILKSDAKTKALGAQMAEELFETQVGTAKQNFLNLQKDAVLKQLDADLKAYEVQLNQKGIQKTDSVPFRKIMEILDAIGFSQRDMEEFPNIKKAIQETPVVPRKTQ